MSAGDRRRPQAGGERAILAALDVHKHFYSVRQGRLATMGTSECRRPQAGAGTVVLAPVSLSDGSQCVALHSIVCTSADSA